MSRRDYEAAAKQAAADTITNCDGGTVTKADATTLTDTSKHWAGNEWLRGKVKIVTGKAAGQHRRIVSHTPDTLTVGRRWSPEPEKGDEYLVWTDREAGEDG